MPLAEEPTIDTPTTGCQPRRHIVSGTYFTNEEKKGDLKVWVTYHDSTTGYPQYAGPYKSAALPNAASGNWSVEVMLDDEHGDSVIKAQLYTDETPYSNVGSKFTYQFRNRCPRALTTEEVTQLALRAAAPEAEQAARDGGRPTHFVRVTAECTDDYASRTKRILAVVVQRRAHSPDQPWSFTDGWFTSPDRKTMQAFVAVPPVPPSTGISYWSYFLLLDVDGNVLTPTGDPQQIDPE